MCKIKQTLETVKKRLLERTSDIEIIYDYRKKRKTGNKTLHCVHCKCKKDNHEWDVSVDNLINKKSNCPKCKNRIRIPINELIHELKSKNSKVKILGEKYEKINNKYKIKTICLVHNFEWYADNNRLLEGRGCPECAKPYQFKTGDKHINWKGGITPLMNYMREISLCNWKKETMKACGYKCVITGKRFDDIHHLYSFNLILNEALLICGHNEKEKISDYTNKQLDAIKNTCLNLHKKYGLGVCLTKEVHIEFHNKYGYGNNTPEQWDEFIIQYNESIV